MAEVPRVTVDRLEGQANWTDWKFQVKIQLQVYNAMSAVDGTLKYPVKISDNASEREVAEYERSVQSVQKIEYMAQNLIVSSLSSQMRQLVNMCNSAKEMWDKLHSVFEQRTEQRQDRLFNQFFAIKEKDPLDSVAKHMAKLEKLWVELQDETWKEDKVKLPESLFMNRVLNTMPTEYFEFMNAWESVPKEQRTVSLLRERLCTVELRLQDRNGEASSTTALVVASGGQIKGKSQKTAHANQARNTKNFKTKFKCHGCGQVGHFKRECPKRLGNNTLISQQGSAFIGVLDPLIEIKEEKAWVADSGATHHMTMQRDWFATWEPFETPQSILVGNGQRMQAMGRGNINVEMCVNGKWMRNYLKDVWYVPDVGRNLFSISSAVDKGITSSLDKDKCLFFKNNSLVASGIRRNGLYFMHMRVLIPHAVAEAQVAAADKLQIWHERLGHQNKRHVQKFLKDRGIDVTVDKEFCDACVYGKQHRLSFGTRICRAERPGELIHADVCGPMPKKSLGGACYFVDFKDDFSRYRSVYFLKEKSEVKSKLENFLAEVKVLNHTVKELLTDGGTEFDNRDVMQIIAKAGVHHRITMPYTPEQDGSAERENRTLVEAARTMLHAKDLPEELWAEAVNTAAYVLNRTGPSQVEGKSPFEIWTGKKAYIEHLKIFGTECFVHVPKQRRKKWDRKSVKGYLVGYKNGYRVWIPEKKDVILSRDVIFKNEVPVKECVNVYMDEFHKYDDDELDSKEDTTFRDETVKSENSTCASEVDNRVLRERSKIKRPARFDAFAMLAEYDEPSTLEEALESRDAIKCRFT